MKHGTVWQRHSRTCPPAVDGVRPRHRCRGTWAYNLEYGRSSTGQRLQSTKGGFPTRAAAQEALRERARVLLADVTITDTSLGEYLDNWLLSKHALRPTTRTLYQSFIKLYLRPHLGHLRLLDLRAHHLDRFYADIALGHRGRPLSPGTIRRVHAVLRSALSTAVKRRLIPYNPAHHVELAPENPRRPRPWTTEQCLQFIDAVGNDRMGIVYALLIHTGMRRGEVMGLRWPAVDLEHHLLRITEQVVEVNGKMVTGAPKTRRSVRAVALDPEMIAALMRVREQQRKERQEWGLHWDEDGLVFTREDGRPYRPEYVTRHFQHLSTAAGLPRLRLHDLRHTSASIALTAGVPLKAVSERLGHSAIAITGDLYTHVQDDVERAAAESMARALTRHSGTLPSESLAQQASEDVP